MAKHVIPFDTIFTGDTVDVNGRINIGDHNDSGFQLFINGEATQGAYGYVNVNVVSSSSETGIQLTNSGEGGNSFTLLSTNDASAVGAGKFIIGDGNIGISRFTIDATNNRFGLNTYSPSAFLHLGEGEDQSVSVQFHDGSLAELSQANTGRIRFNRNDGRNQFELSEDESSYFPFSCAGMIYWKPFTDFADIYALVQERNVDNNRYIAVVIDGLSYGMETPTYVVPPGEYDLSSVLFYGSGNGYMTVMFQDGVTLVGEDGVYINSVGVDLIFAADMTASDTFVAMYLYEASIFSSSESGPCFPSVASGSYLDMYKGQAYSPSYPIFTISNPNSFYLTTKGAARIYNDVIGGDGGLEIMADPLSRADILEQAGLAIYSDSVSSITAPMITGEEFLVDNMLGIDVDEGLKRVYAGEWVPAVPINGVYYWSSGKTWNELWVEIQAGGGFGTVIMASGIEQFVSAGTYDLTHIHFVSYGIRALLTFDVGALIDGSSYLTLSCSNVHVYGQAPLMTPGTKPVYINIDKGLLSNYGSTDPLFTTSGNSWIILRSANLLRQAGGGAVIHASGGSTNIILEMTGKPVSPPTLLNVDVITGISGTSVTLLTDALNAAERTYGIQSGMAITITAGAQGRLSLPQRATADLPSPSSGNAGELFYDTTVSRGKLSNGSIYKTLSMSDGVYYWTSAKTWAQVWAEVVAGGGYGTIFVDDLNSTRTITAAQGPYDFTGIIFECLTTVGSGFVVSITFEANTLIDAGSYVALRAKGRTVRFGCSTPLMTVGAAKKVVIELYNGASFGPTADITAFNTTSTAFGGAVQVYLEGRIYTTSNSTNPVFYLGASGCNMNMAITALGANMGSGTLTFSGLLAGGVSGAGVGVYANPLAAGVVQDTAVASPLTLFVVNSSALFIPQNDENSLITPSARSRGTMIWSTISNMPKICDGYSYRTIPIRMANASDTLLTTTSATTVITYTPVIASNYTIPIYFRVVTGTTTLTITVSWTDGSGAQTTTPVSGAQTVGSYTMAPVYINSTASAITVSATAGTANQVYVSSTITGV